MWRATITLTGGGELSLFSGTEIFARLLRDTGFLLLHGEFDTIGLPFSQVASFHIYEQGVLAA